ncbi:HTH_Tnp_Tc3_2 domain-containing protein [Trichonephila clavipes]|nr:HTH_Tnp_Tc3_2 domain-containing protein [Trichonephila clavipes]
MARIVRHNDESVREGCIRNGGKEVKLFTIALNAFQCNNRIVMAQRKYLDAFLRGRIIERLECGRIQLKVSEELGIAQSVISRFWKRFQNDGNVSRSYSTGRPRISKLNEDRYLAVTAKRNRRSISYRYDSFKADRVLTLRTLWSISGMANQWHDGTRHNILGTLPIKKKKWHVDPKRFTIPGLYARRPVRCVPLTATPCHLRLTWSREHALWTPQQWSCVMFSDESRFSLPSDSNRTLIRRAPGTSEQENIIE